ncbi:MAG TPA: efflux RND transporter permease subunit [Jatrophihabitans sp.]|jgi:Cu/Ag efflux pump CusA|uniref:efflux RND transporter permease subunit n=1 Tax=Jatrophihabitans sp. TaxID=1932789 RepID=UPI002F21B71F
MSFRLVVVLLAASIMSFGFVLSRDAQVEVLPEFKAPYVEVQTEALGLSAVEVEQLITSPMEADLLNGVAFLDEIRSMSVPGLSSIELYFEEGTDVLRARQMVQERLTEARALPNVSKAPVMIQPLSSTGRAMMIGLSSQDVSLIDLSVLARWKIKPKLMGVPGVANVAIWGQRERQLQVQVDPQRLSDRGVTLSQVIRTTANSLWVSPLSFVEASTPGTGGFIDTPQQRLGIQHVLPITTPADLSRVSLEGRQGSAGRTLGEVVAVTEDHQPLIGDALSGDDPQLLLVIEKFPGASTLTVTRDVEKAMQSLAPGLRGIVVDTQVYRPATFLENALDNLGIAALLGLLLMIIVIGALSSSWRLALISVATILVSLTAALTVLQLRGTTFNTMILAGLVIALGVIIDDAVTEADNTRRALQHRGASPDGDGQSPADAVAASVARLRSPLLFATLVLIVAALPLLLLKGVTDSIFSPFVMSYVLAVLASLVVALTLTPALAIYLLRAGQTDNRDRPIVRWLRTGHRRALPRLVHRPVLAYAGLGVLLLIGLAFVPGLGGDSTMPARQDRDLLVRWDAAPGTSLPAMREQAAALTRDLRAIDGVRSVGAHVGRAVTSDQVVGVNSGELWVSLKPEAAYDRAVRDVQRLVKDRAGPQVSAIGYPEQRMLDLGPTNDPPIVVRVYGTDLELLRQQGEDVRQRLTAVRGTVQPQLRMAPVEQTVQIEVDLARAQQHGLKPGDVRRAAATLIAGIQVGSLFEEQKVFDVIVVGTPATRENLSDVQNLLIDTPGGKHVRLRQVADVRVTPSPNVLRHDSVSRYVDVVADVRGRDVDEVTDEVRAALATLELPVSYHAELRGDYAERQDAQVRLGLLGLATALLIFLLLQAAFASWRLATLMSVALLAALVGGVAVARLDQGALSRTTLLALLTVVGITARQGIVLIRQWEELDRAANGRPDPAAVSATAHERLAPIVTTALAVAAAVTPLLFLGAVAGQELIRPIAAVILGGLVTSVLVLLFLLPPLYLRHAPARRPDVPAPQRTGPVPFDGSDSSNGSSPRLTHVAP